MADAILEMEAHLKDYASKNMAEMAANMKATNEAMVTQFGESMHRSEEHAKHHAEVLGLTHREIKKTAHEGMMGVVLATEMAENGFVGAKGALEGFNLALVAWTSGAKIGGLMGLAAIVSYIANQMAEAKKNAKDTTWFTNPEAVKQTFAAYDEAKEKVESLDEKVKEARANYRQGGPGAFDPGLMLQITHMKDTQEALEKTRGTTKAAMDEAFGGAAKLAEIRKTLTEATENYRHALESLNTLETNGVVIQAEAALKEAQAGDNALARMKIQGKAKIDEQKNQLEILKAKQTETLSAQRELEAQLAIKKEGKEGTKEENKEKEELEKKIQETKDGYARYTAEINAAEKVLALTKQTIHVEQLNQQHKQAQELAMQNEADFKEMDRQQLEAQAVFTRQVRQQQEIDAQLQEDSADEKFAKQRAAAEKHYDEMLNKAREAYKGFENEDALYKNKSIEINNARAEALSRIDQDEMMARVQIAHGMASDILAAWGAFYANSRKNHLLHKSLAIAQIEIDGALAAANAIAHIEPLPLGLAAAALIELKTQALAYKASNQKFARGTQYAPGGMAMVGEEGPEMMFVPQGAQIFTANETRNIMNRNQAQNIHLGDTVINMAAGTSPEQARALGAAVVDGKKERLAQLSRDLKELPYFNKGEI